MHICQDSRPPGRSSCNAIAERSFGCCETALWGDRLTKGGREGTSLLTALSPPCPVCFISGPHRGMGRRTGRSWRGEMGLCRGLNFSHWVAAEIVGKEELMGKVIAQGFNSFSERKRMAVTVRPFLCEHQVTWRSSLGEGQFISLQALWIIRTSNEHSFSKAAGGAQVKFWIQPVKWERNLHVEKSGFKAQVAFGWCGTDTNAHVGSL